jgi:hypothetical protein
MGLHSVLKHIVRNDAIRIDPPEIYNMRIIALACSVRQDKPHLFANIVPCIHFYA